MKFLAFTLLSLLVLVQASSAPGTKGDEPSNDCSLYLAKSSIPNAGLGVFAARSYRMGDKIVSLVARCVNL